LLTLNLDFDQVLEMGLDPDMHLSKKTGYGSLFAYNEGGSETLYVVHSTELSRTKP
jgi:hypothetical protein